MKLKPWDFVLMDDVVIIERAPITTRDQGLVATHVRFPTWRDTTLISMNWSQN